jgi:signal transduction histidine kinase
VSPGSQASPRREALAAWAALALLVGDAALQFRLIAAPLAAALLLLALARRRRPLPLFAAAACLVAGAAHARLAYEARTTAADAHAAARGALQAVERRAQRVVEALQQGAADVAALPEARDAIAGDADALSRLFLRLEQTRERLPERPALAVHAPPLSTLAWAGRTTELRAWHEDRGTARRIVVLSGSVSTTFVATAPITAADGRLVGVASADLVVMARRNISNEYLSDFDLLAGADGSVDVFYFDSRDVTSDLRTLPSPPPSALTEESVLRGPEGVPLAVARATAPNPDEVRSQIALAFGRAISALVVFACLAWMAGGFGAPGLRVALAATALRLALLLLGPPLPEPGSPLRSPDVYASAPAPLAALSWTAPLLRSPLDLLLTSAWLALLCGLLAWRGASRPQRPAPPLRALAVSLAAVPLAALPFACIADTVANCSLDLENVRLVGNHPALVAVQLSLLLVLAAGAALLFALFLLAGPLPASRAGALARVGSWLLLGVLAHRLWPRELIGLPLLPAVFLFLVPAALAAGAFRWQPRLRQAPTGALAGVALAATAGLGLLLYPSLVHYGEKSTRQQIERDHAPLVLRQPQWRAYVLAEAQRRIDALELLEEAPPGPYPPGIEELAFAVWSETDLAAFGFSSAVEVQDATGAVISRFALNLPSLSGPDRPLPAGTGWQVSRDQLKFASAERRVLHARRALVYHGEVHGGVHVYVGDDFWNLPFVTGRDPYSVLFRPAPKGSPRDRAVALLAYGSDREVVFSSEERPPALRPELARRLEGRGAGLWTTLEIDGQPHHTFLFSDGPHVYGLAYRRLGALRYAAGLAEAASALTLLAALVLVGLVLFRTALGRRTLSLHSMARGVRQSFGLRLFVAFTLLAFVPVAVLQVVVRGFAAERLRIQTERQALELGAVAKKAVDDFAYYQRGEEDGGAQQVTDAALVWVSSLIRNDLDVFERGRLLASSKRELYASGLMPPRVSGAVFRALLLDGQPSVLRTESIGGFSFLVVSLPVELGARARGILSVPLALRQREVIATVEDLDRTIRLASLFFLGLAALLAHSMARRISGPIRELTRATSRVAQGDLEARVAPAGEDELRGLVESFNRMAGDLQRQRRDLERSNRLAAWAEMARQVAHEVKNPLTPIQLSAEHLRRAYRDSDRSFASTLETCTQTILKQVRILRGIVTEFSAFARPPAPDMAPHDLAELLPGLLRPYQAALPPEVGLSFRAERPLPLVWADRRLIERAVVNLLENAVQAVGDRGSIEVVLRPSADGGGVELELADSGSGIDPEVRDRLFEPFFSTKTGGSGLGLPLVKRIVEDHGGSVALRGAPGAGTRAVVWLPAGAAPGAPARPEPHAPPEPGLARTDDPDGSGAAAAELAEGAASRRASGAGGGPGS